MGHTDADRRRTERAVLTGENTFPTLPGTMLGVACPVCFRDQLLAEVVRSGRCLGCGADLELSVVGDETDY